MVCHCLLFTLHEARGTLFATLFYPRVHDARGTLFATAFY